MKSQEVIATVLRNSTQPGCEHLSSDTIELLARAIDAALQPVLVKVFRQRVAAAHWKLDLYAFCKQAGLRVDDYSKGLFNDFRLLNEKLGKFDVETLARVLDGGSDDNRATETTADAGRSDA